MFRSNGRRTLLKRVTAIVGIACWNCTCLRHSSAGDSAAPAAVSAGRRQLFVDDVNIQRMDRLERVVNPVVKHRSNPLVVPEKPWEAGTLILDNAVVYDETGGQFKMYCLVPGFVAGGARRTSYLTSLDGMQWARPELGLVEFEGSGRNNILSIHVSHVIYDPCPGEPAGRAFKGVGWGLAEGTPQAAQGKAGQYAAFSPDGVHWSIADGFALSSAGDVFVPSRTKEIQKLGRAARSSAASRPYDVLPSQAAVPEDPPYMGFVRTIERVGKFDRRVLTFTKSNDFLKWSTPAAILKPDALDDQLSAGRLNSAPRGLAFDHPDDRRCEFYYLTGFRYEGIYLGFLFVFDVSYERSRIGRSNQDGPRYVELVFSRDLKDWRRLPGRVPFIPLGPAGTWDGGMIGYAAAPILVDDEIRIYYGGQRLTHGARWEEEIEKLRSGQAQPLSSVGLSTLRCDGWVSLDAGEQAGTLFTKTFPMPEGKLFLNADARDGEVLVELLDVSRATLLEARPITGDQLRAEIEFVRPVPAPGALIQLQLTARNAKLFSYWFEVE